jgi:hypothetical protein
MRFFSEICFDLVPNSGMACFKEVQYGFSGYSVVF